MSKNNKKFKIIKNIDMQPFISFIYIKVYIRRQLRPIIAAVVEAIEDIIFSATSFFKSYIF